MVKDISKNELKIWSVKIKSHDAANEFPEDSNFWISYFIPYNSYNDSTQQDLHVHNYLRTSTIQELSDTFHAVLEKLTNQVGKLRVRRND